MTKYKEGTKLLIEMTEGETYEGTFSYGDDFRLTLYNVSEYPSGSAVQGDGVHVQYFYKAEIASISVIQEANASHEDKIIAPIVTLEEDKFEKLKELSHKLIYIAVVDNQYISAIKFLKTCSEIAVFGLGSLYGRNSKIVLLTVATKHQIYMFDIKLSQGNRAFEMGLKELLESTDILKIVHDSKTFADCLLHGHKTTLNNVFDTQVADYILKKNGGKIPEKMRPFSECVHDYLNIPASVITNSQMNLKQLLERPLSEEKKQKSALDVAYLYVLKDILQRKMLETFYRTTNVYLDCMRNEEPGTARKLLNYDVPEVVEKLHLTN